jgi:hypothetical protein
MKLTKEKKKLITTNQTHPTPSGSNQLQHENVGVGDFHAPLS